jgi:formylglycine-generating enzyme required for sulfatase activity
MDYLQELESQMAAMQRKLRLLQDLRFFFDSVSPEELAGFGEELRSITMASGESLASALAALVGTTGGGPGRGPLFSSSAAGALGRSTLTGRQEPSARQTAPTPVGSEATPPPISAIASDAPTAGGAPEAAAPRVSAAPTPGSSPASADGPSASAEALGLVEAAMKTIAASSFLMGSEANDEEKPPHKVSLGAYRVCDHLITNKEYSLFVAANPQWSKDRADPDLRDERYLEDWSGDAYPEDKEENPVAFVSFFAARAFADWIGKRLLTEAEWECAARGGLVGKKYPNGDLMNDKLANLAKQYRGTTPVRKFEPNGFGLYDMAGNLFEWTSDWYGHYAPGEARDPKGPAEGEYRVVRGGSWMSGAGALRVSARVDMEPRSCGQVGIRLAD